LDQRVDNIIKTFEGFSTWEDRYKHLISMGKALEVMSEDEHAVENLIKGCQSQVWLSAKLVGDKVILCGDSDASIVKGIVALLLEVYSGRTPDEILSTAPDFVDKIGLKQHLSMSRANGLSSMLKQISFYAMAYKAKLSL
jgi:cysteine desulfuration protein SufE